MPAYAFGPTASVQVPLIKYDINTFAPQHLHTYWLQVYLVRYRVRIVFVLSTLHVRR